MLIEFTAENFRSIKEEVQLSLVAASGKELYDTNVTELKLPVGIKDISLLRSVVLYGPNASGKSNLIKALATMRQIVLTSHENLEVLPVTPFKLSETTLNAPSVFEVIILVNGVRYQYGFSATKKIIHGEWLYAFPRGQAQIWFKRDLNMDSGKHEYVFGNNLAGNKVVWKQATRSNALFLSTAIQLNSEQLLPIFNWFAKKLRVVRSGWSPGFSIDWCQDERKHQILQFLKAADFAISDVQVKEEDFSFDSIFSDLPNQIRQLLEHELQGKKQFQLTTLHRSELGESVLNFDEESDGTKKMFSFAGPWLDSLSNGRVLFIDEMHDNLHPLLVKFLVQLFHSSETNNNLAQLVFSTHDTSILSQEIFRRDQIWFCERTSAQDTRLYPLTEFSSRKNSENIEKAYLSGRYGALPFLRAITKSFGG